MTTIEEFQQFVHDHGGDLGLLNKLLTPKGKDYGRLIAIAKAIVRWNRRAHNG